MFAAFPPVMFPVTLSRDEKFKRVCDARSAAVAKTWKMSTFWQTLITFNHHIVTALSPFRLERHNAGAGEASTAVCSCDINKMQTSPWCSPDKASKLLLEVTAKVWGRLLTRATHAKATAGS